MLKSGKAITNIVEKANIFDELFASQCISLENGSKLPSFLINTDNCLNAVSIEKGNVTSIIKPLNPTKVHGFDKILICMIQ